MDNIRNFSIIAHIDHGKSTLSDRLIQKAEIVSDRDFMDQVLDSMDLERERGITIKSQTICLPYTAADGRLYYLNLIDTPGHVDFSYEVSRALASCEGALLLIDASQGVEAQTIANMYLAVENDLEIIPVINKIDLPSAEVENVKEQIAEDLGLDPDDAILCSAKEWMGIEAVFEAIITHLPPPSGDPKAPLRALIFDSNYDPYRGTIVHFRVLDGRIKPGDEILFMSNKAAYTVEEVGIFQLKRVAQKEISAGRVGYLIAGIKTVSDTRCGDTITLKKRPCEKPLSGFQESKPVVFSSIYPVSTDEYPDLAAALEKLKLNDASLVYQKDSSVALGFGFRCGFLGLLHLEVVQERLEREFDLSIVFTAPSVRFRVYLTSGEMKEIDNPTEWPDPMSIEYTEEPYIRAAIITPSEYLGNLMNICMEKRGVQQ